MDGNRTAVSFESTAIDCVWAHAMARSRQTLAPNILSWPKGLRQLGHVLHRETHDLQWSAPQHMVCVASTTSSWHIRHCRSTSSLKTARRLEALTKVGETVTSLRKTYFGILDESGSLELELESNIIRRFRLFIFEGLVQVINGVRAHLFSELSASQVLCIMLRHGALVNKCAAKGRAAVDHASAARGLWGARK